MTKAQQQALDRIDEIMKEHFNAAVVVVSGDINDHQDEIVTRWSGGYPAAVGLTELAKIQIWHGRINNNEPRSGEATGEVAQD